jgi:hypothetical protein
MTEQDKDKYYYVVDKVSSFVDYFGPLKVLKDLRSICSDSIACSDLDQAIAIMELEEMNRNARIESMEQSFYEEAM